MDEFRLKTKDSRATRRRLSQDSVESESSHTVQHAEAKIGDSIIMMGEAQGEWKPKPATLYVYVDDVDAVYRRALQAGATSLREPANQFYGDRSGGVQDESGNQWWIATHIEHVTPEEMARRAQAAGH
ncbi:MAG: VOC family protein [Acidobacteriia bacterium]|nr:VOC family protein [Terriglobia bacterium]